MKNKILIAEDEPHLRELVASYLKKEGFDVIEAKNGVEALDKFAQNDFSLVILDVMMPVKDGLSVCAEIRQESNVPIVMLTSRSEEFDELSGFSSGADEYITKPFSPAILITRIKSVLRRAGSVENDDLEFGDIKIYKRQRQVKIKDEIIILTPREFTLLEYLILNKNIVLSREQILLKVWGYDYDGDVRTVDTHIKCLRSKMMSSKDSIKTIRKVGYTITDSDKRNQGGYNS